MLASLMKIESGSLPRTRRGIYIIESETERDKKLWEKPQPNKIQGYRNQAEKINFSAHEADITGKLLSKRRSMNPAKVKGVMIETNEQDIEEISSKALPAVCRSARALEGGA